VYGVVGPSFNIGLKARQSDLDVASNYESFDTDIVGGVGVEITRFIIEVRGMWGLRNVVGGDLANNFSIKDKSFAIMFGVRVSG